MRMTSWLPEVYLDRQRNRAQFAGLLLQLPVDECCVVIQKQGDDPTLVAYSQEDASGGDSNIQLRRTR